MEYSNNQLLTKTNRSELVIILFTTSILLILFLPIPALLLDFLLIINFSWAFTILILCFHTDKPLSFSTFPALLLISTLFRLALNISATRLILSEGQAGQVIAAVGHYVIHGNYAMGLVVFCILIIVQFIVVTNGAQRVAEVAARFTLDSMPGKQMSIDADLNMGLISQDIARQRRSQIEKEANFYGAMDGASKFVKGDAIAGILIVIVDILGGFFIGIVQKNQTVLQALHNYTLLTVGDGLVTQVPALIISTATGIIVTRAATDSPLGTEVSRQIAAYPRSLIIVCFSLLLLMMVKGMPRGPIICILILFIIAAYFSIKEKTNSPLPPQEETLYEKIKIYPIELVMNLQLYEEFNRYEESFNQQIQQFRENFALEHGFVFPEVRIRAEPKITYPFYSLSIQGNLSKNNALYLDRFLAINTKPQALIESINPRIEVRDPTYGLPSIWIMPEQKALAEANKLSVHDSLTVLITHLQDYLQEQLKHLLTRDEVDNLLNQPELARLKEELIPHLMPMNQLHKILQGLLEEKVSIRPMALILETLLDYAKTINEPSQLIELIRTRLATLICQKLLNNEGYLSVVTLAPSLEKTLMQSLVNNHLALAPDLMEQFLKNLAIHVEKMLQERRRPILLCSSLLRAQIRRLTQRVIPHLTVLALTEIPLTVQIESFGILN